MCRRGGACVGAHPFQAQSALVGEKRAACADIGARAQVNFFFRKAADFASIFSLSRKKDIFFFQNCNMRCVFPFVRACVYVYVYVCMCLQAASTKSKVWQGLCKAKQQGLLPGIVGRLGDLAGIDAKVC